MGRSSLVGFLCIRRQPRYLGLCPFSEQSMKLSSQMKGLSYWLRSSGLWLQQFDFRVVDLMAPKRLSFVGAFLLSTGCFLILRVAESRL